MFPRTDVAAIPLNGVGRGRRPWRVAACRYDWAKLLAASLPILLFMVGCANQGGAINPAAQTIHVGTELAADQAINRHLYADPPTLDPALSVDVYGQMVLEDMFEGLTTVGMDGSTIPGVAASWDTSADGKTWTFQLRKEARWS